jgi:hypothetical protein
MIDEYKFGKMVVNGETHEKDLIITKEKVIPNWWRDKGHKLQLEDIQQVLEEYKPEVLVVGKGKFGMMKVAKEVNQYLEENQIRLYEKESGKATQEFNRLLQNDVNVVGAFHLTC